MNTQYFYSGSTQRFHGLSTDTKPTGCSNGSVFFEMDTSYVYIYDADSSEWNKIDNDIDYDSLSNLPYINNIPVKGSKTLSDFGIAATSDLIELIDSGSKNKLHNILATGSTSRSVVATVGSDGTMTLSGTVNSSTADAAFIIMTSTPIKAGTYHGSGCPADGATAKYRIDFVVNESTTYRDVGNGVDFTLSTDGTVRANVVVYRGKTAPSATWYPMICSKAAYSISPAFVPYAPTNAELYQMIVAQTT